MVLESAKEEQKVGAGEYYRLDRLNLPNPSAKSMNSQSTCISGTIVTTSLIILISDTGEFNPLIPETTN